MLLLRVFVLMVIGLAPAQAQDAAEKEAKACWDGKAAGWKAKPDRCGDKLINTDNSDSVTATRLK